MAFGVGHFNGVIYIYLWLTPIAMATKFTTKRAITQSPYKIIVHCLHLPPIFNPGLFDGVI